MSIEDFIKKIFPIKINLLNIEKLNYTNYNTKIDKYLSIRKVDNLTIEDEDNVLGFVRKDLLDTIAKIISPDKKYKAYVDDFKLYLNDDDHAALIMAIAIIKYEESGNPMIANKRLKQLFAVYPTRGSKIYNLLVSGYFDEYIYPKLLEVKEKFGNDDFSIRGEFSYFFDEVLKFFKYAIWISEDTKIEGIKKNLLHRLIKLNQPIVFAHTRKAENILKLDRAIKELLESETYRGKFELMEWEYPIRGAKGKTTVLINKELSEFIIKKRKRDTDKKEITI